jgi:hypothetical protein
LRSAVAGGERGPRLEAASWHDDRLVAALKFCWSPSLLALLLACSSAPPPAATPPAASASVAPPTATAPGAPSGGTWAAFDPRVVRCGVDDRPANVLGLVVPRDTRPRLADRAFPSAKPRPQGPTTSKIELFNPEEAPRLLYILPETPTMAGAPVTPPELAAALAQVNPQYEVCSSLADENMPDVQLRFELELASSGAPLRVLPVDQGPINTLGRCLMERACQYQTHVALGQPRRVTMELRLTYTPPPAIKVPRR